MSATGDYHQLEELFERARGAEGIAIATGQNSKLLVLDIDKRSDYDALSQIQAEFDCDLLEYPHVKTPSGGYHIYFAYDKALHGHISSIVAFRRNIDIKCESGYVVAPPTRFASGSYVWAPFGDDIPASLPLKPIPDWLIDAIRQHRSTPTLPVYQRLDGDGDIKLSHILLRTILKDALQQVANAKKGSRKNTLRKQAYRLGIHVPHGMNIPIAKDRLSKLASRWTDIPTSKCEQLIEHSFSKGVSDGKRGKATIPKQEMQRIEREKVALLAKEAWSNELPRREDIEGKTTQEILSQWLGWERIFQNQEKAALNFIAETLRCHGYKHIQNRRDGHKAYRWYLSNPAPLDL